MCVFLRVNAGCCCCWVDDDHHPMDAPHCTMRYVYCLLFPPTKTHRQTASDCNCVCKSMPSRQLNLHNEWYSRQFNKWLQTTTESTSTHSGLIRVYALPQEWSVFFNSTTTTAAAGEPTEPLLDASNHRRRRTAAQLITISHNRLTWVVVPSPPTLNKLQTATSGIESLWNLKPPPAPQQFQC